jgi:hypothetical protein
MIQTKDVVWLGNATMIGIGIKLLDKDIGDSMEEYLRLNTKKAALKRIKSLKE